MRVGQIGLLCGLACLVSASDAQDGSSDPGSAVTVSPAGVQRFASGGWASLSVVGVNPTDQDVTETVSVFIGDDPNLQFSTEIWIPANSKRQSWLPVKVPPRDRITGDRVDLSMIRIVSSNGSESFDNNFVGMPLSKRSLLLADNEINTGLFTSSRPLVTDDASTADQLELNRTINAGRDAIIDSSMELPPTNFRSNFLPPTYEALDELDQAVVAGDQLLGDTSGIVALRRWVRRGGRLWIMLDRTGDDLVRELLGDQMTHSVVDRVEVNQFRMEVIDPVLGLSNRPVHEWTSEQPAELVRVLTDAADVTCRIDGWPAAFWIPVGDGEVLLTTVSARGWLGIEGGSSVALHSISRRFFEPRRRTTDMASAMYPLVDSKIGYSIPRRGVAAALLGANSIIILVCGIWWARLRRLERMAYLIPISAGVTTIAMIMIGKVHVQAVPSTVATGQVIQVRDATGEADVATTHAVYSQDATDLELRSAGGALTVPASLTADSQTRRIGLDSGGVGRWHGPPQPPGVVRHLVSNFTVPLQEPIRVFGTFDEEGFVGTLVGTDPGQCSDAMIVSTPSPRVSAAIEPVEPMSGRVTAAASDLLSPGQFVPGTMISDEQRLHQEFLGTVFQSPETNSLGAGPSLLFWSTMQQTQTSFGDQFRRDGTSVVSVPIALSEPEPGVDFHVPATFINMNLFAGRQGVSALYNPRTGTWLRDLTEASSASLVFEFPDALAFMNLNRVNVRIRINAPDRSLIVKAMIDGTPTEVFRANDPTGLVQFSIDQPEALARQEDGTLWLDVGVTESASAARRRAESTSTDRRIVADNTTWTIDRIDLDAVGTIPRDVDRSRRQTVSTDATH